MIDEEMDFTDAKMLRQKAEEQLKQKQKDAASQEKETDMKKLLHELQVHQIELEMQNEELRQAYETTEAALKKYTMLFDLAPVGYFSLDQDGTICELNFTGADILGERRFSLIDSNFKLFVSEGSRLVFNNFFRNVFTSTKRKRAKYCLVIIKNPYVMFIWKALLPKMKINAFYRS
jgi:PAS domain-containing protein